MSSNPKPSSRLQVEADTPVKFQIYSFKLNRTASVFKHTGTIIFLRDLNSQQVLGTYIHEVTTKPIDGPSTVYLHKLDVYDPARYEELVLAVQFTASYSFIHKLATLNYDHNYNLLGLSLMKLFTICGTTETQPQECQHQGNCRDNAITTIDEIKELVQQEDIKDMEVFPEAIQMLQNTQGNDNQLIVVIIVALASVSIFALFSKPKKNSKKK